MLKSQGLRFKLCGRVGVGPVLYASLLCAPALRGQDTRVVTEPVIPRPCVVLFAHQMAGNVNDQQPFEELDTARIQAAIDGCAVNHSVELAVKLPSKFADPMLDAFVTGPLQLRQGVTLLVDNHVILYASRDPKQFEIQQAGLAAPVAEPRPAWMTRMLGADSGNAGAATPEKPESELKCGTREPRPEGFPRVAIGPARPRGGCRPLISVSYAKNAGIMGDGTIDGRGYAQIMGHDYSWWELARASEPKDDLYYSIRMITADHADGFTLYRIHLVNSANYHVSVSNTNGFTAWGVHLQTPVNKDFDARNTDGIDPGTSQNITVAHSWIDNGDDNIAIKQGVTHMSVLDDHFYTGHGMSIGSETVLGQSYVYVDGLTEDHTTSGIRIKSNVKRGGPVHDLVYRNVCMRGVGIPISISPYYTNQTTEPFEDPRYEGDQIPDYKAIRLQNIYSENPGDVLIAGLNEQHRTGVSLEDVTVKDILPSQVHLAFDDIRVTTCAAHKPATNIPLDEVPDSVTVLDTPSEACAAPAPDPCAGKFLPMQ